MMTRSKERTQQSKTGQQVRLPILLQLRRHLVRISATILIMRTFGRGSVADICMCGGSVPMCGRGERLPCVSQACVIGQEAYLANFGLCLGGLGACLDGLETCLGSLGSWSGQPGRLFGQPGGLVWAAWESVWAACGACWAAWRPVLAMWPVWKAWRSRICVRGRSK